MKITALVENTTANEALQASHGLSLYIETQKHKLLVDTGNGDLFLKNAKTLGIDIASVDILIITHGHMDHGGGLKFFLDINKTAKVYVQQTAFRPHYTKFAKIFKAYIGLDTAFSNHPQVVLVDGDKQIDDEISLITNPTGKKFLPKFNASLLEKKGKRIAHDEFVHEQSIIIKENKTVLIGGCGHRGIINIVEDAKKKSDKPIDICISGFHLSKPLSNVSESTEVLTSITEELKNTDIKYYTCHCTGTEVFKFMQGKMSDQINYLATGQTIEI